MVMQLSGIRPTGLWNAKLPPLEGSPLVHTAMPALIGSVASKPKAELPPRLATTGEL